MNNPLPPATADRLSLEVLLARAGVSMRLLRDCESLGWLGDADARGYDVQALHTLRFVRRAQGLGFEHSEVAALLALWQDEGRACFEVQRVALARADELAERIEELEARKRQLERLAACCAGDQRPDCPILDELAELRGFAGCHGAKPA